MQLAATQRLREGAEQGKWLCMMCNMVCTITWLLGPGLQQRLHLQRRQQLGGLRGLLLRRGLLQQGLHIAKVKTHLLHECQQLARIQALCLQTIASRSGADRSMHKNASIMSTDMYY